MDSHQKRKISRVLWSVLPLLLLASTVRLHLLRNRLHDLQGQIAETRLNCARLKRNTHLLRTQLKEYLPDLKKYTVSISDPIAWSIDRIRGTVGIADFEITTEGIRAPVELRTSREMRDEKDGLFPVLAPYRIHLSFERTTLPTLLYVFEELESSRNAAIVQQLSVLPDPRSESVSATAVVSYPAFLYPEDWKDIREFLSEE